MAELFATLQSLFTFAFVVSSMLSMGLALTVTEVLAPLRNGRLVVLGLLANFVAVPLVGLGLVRLIPMDEDLQIGLVLLATAAGAPFLPKLAQVAHASVSFAVGLMALLIVVTVIYLPIVLPVVLPGVEVPGGRIAVALFGQMLLPLGIGLAVRARWEHAADDLRQPVAQVSNLSLALLLVLMLGLNIEEVIGLFGSGALIATVLLVAIAIGVGYLLGGPATSSRRVLALGTGQRNLAAAFLIGSGSFGDRPDVMAFLAGAGLIGMVLVKPLAAEFGRRASTPGPDSARSREAAPPAVADAGAAGTDLRANDG